MALRSGRVGIHPSQVDPITGMLLNGPTPGSISFEDLSDAQIASPEAGQTLQYNGTGWENVFASISPTTLAELQDVQITDPEDGAYLVYDAENDKWINSVTPPAPVVPEGSTVTPTDDIQTWLACAGITDKTYTTLNEVLADSTTLLALMSSNNAADYLVRSTTWASGITANSAAMTDIGANNYCANTLLDDATWCTAICNSTYFESVLNVKVPTMTGTTTPSGECIYSAEYTGGNNYAWKAFDKSTSSGSFWSSYQGNPAVPGYVGYDFTNQIKLCRCDVTVFSDSNGLQIKDYIIQGSNDNSAWDDFYSGTVDSSTADKTIITTIITDDAGHRYCRVYASTSYFTSVALWEVQFYGRQDI